ncbi:MAG: PQQ-dependent sugar dehydrogenase [Chloroflexi bacterium]|nr:PQQ-dependent sugar dehydrogenase [Chloroflexota bacterium]
MELVAEGFTAPVALVEPLDGSSRLFIVDQIGVIWVLHPEGVLLSEPFLDIGHLLVPLQAAYDERGLLGLAFHPQFAQNGRFFIYYSAPLRAAGPPDWDHTNIVSELLVSADNPNLADPQSQRIILEIDHQRDTHNAGQLAFGPDGYLYIGDGDGGGRGDPGDDAQNPENLLGKVLRIDVDQGNPYAIPPDNPFVGREGADEIFAYGLRNPWRFSFDPTTDRLFVADVGQRIFEEVNIVTNGGNYGWDIKEGTSCFNEQNISEPLPSCPNVGASGEPLIDPIIEYNHRQGQAIIGGYVYRGNALPSLYGLYIFGDWGLEQGKIFVAAPPPSAEGMWSFQELQIAEGSPWNLEGLHILSFGQDNFGELYVLTTAPLGPTGNTGRVFRIISPE